MPFGNRRLMPRLQAWGAGDLLVGRALSKPHLALKAYLAYLPELRLHQKCRGRVSPEGEGQAGGASGPVGMRARQSGHRAASLRRPASGEQKVTQA